MLPINMTLTDCPVTSLSKSSFSITEPSRLTSSHLRRKAESRTAAGTYISLPELLSVVAVRCNCGGVALMIRPENLCRTAARRASTTGLQYLAWLYHCCWCERSASTAGKTQEIVTAQLPCTMLVASKNGSRISQSSDSWAHSHDVKMMFLYPPATRTKVQRTWKKGLAGRTPKSESKSKSIAFKSKSKSESLQPKSKSKSKSSKNGLKSGLESKSRTRVQQVC